MDKIFNKPFAINGARVAIPENGTENERVSFDKGFTQPYEVEAPSVDNPSGQGFNILRPEMNEILNQLSNACNVLAENIDKWTALTTENLNDIKQAGRYYQQLNINATDERNYPANIAGYLIVVSDGNINNYGVTQIYKIFNSNQVYIRRATSSTTWGLWDSFVLTSEFDNKITTLQNTDTNLNNNKEDKTKFTNGIINATTNSNLDNLTQNGFYWRTANTGNPLPTTNGGAVIVDTNGNQVIQYFYTDIWDATNGGAWFRTRNANNVWTDWHHLENSEHAEATYRKIADSYTKTETNNRLNQKEDKTKISTQDLTTENLNNIEGQGYFRQAQNANATTERNYPIQQAGTLINLIPAGSGNAYLKQIYLPINNNLVFVRARSGSLVWTNWERLALKSEVDLKRNISDSYTKSEVYTKTETNNLMVAGGYSRNNYTAENIANATIFIPNKSIITGCCIMVTGIYNMGTNGPLDTDFIFKIDGVEIGRINLHKNGQTGAGIGTFHLINQGFFNLSEKLGKTIIPSIQQNNGSITSFNFLVVWQ